MDPNNNNNNPNLPFDFNDPTFVNNPAFIRFLNTQMNFSQPFPSNQPQMGFGNWNQPQDRYGFGNWNQQQMNVSQHFDRQRVIDSPPHSPDVEFVQETQEIPETQPGGSRQQNKKRAHRKKLTDEPRARPTAMAWSPDEEMSLCKAWLEVTEDPPNFQKEKTYWRRITDVFLALENKPAGYRDPDGVSAKWRKMRPQITNFTSIYNRLTNANNHLSGANDADVIKNALGEYRGTYHKTFGFLGLWEKLRKSSKFHLVVERDVRATRGQPSAKRSKTSSSANPSSQGSDAHINIDLNEFEADESMFESMFPERPAGRDAAKKAAHAGSSSKGKGKARYDESFENLSMKLDGLMDISKERISLGKKKVELAEKKLKQKEETIKLAELKVLTTDYSHLPEPERSIMRKAQEDIKHKYGYY